MSYIIYREIITKTTIKKEYIQTIEKEFLRFTTNKSLAMKFNSYEQANQIIEGNLRFKMIARWNIDVI